MAVLRNPCPSGSPRKVEQGTIGLQQSAESTFVSMQGGVRFWQQLPAPAGEVWFRVAGASIAKGTAVRVGNLRGQM